MTPVVMVCLPRLSALSPPPEHRAGWYRTPRSGYMFVVVELRDDKIPELEIPDAAGRITLSFYRDREAALAVIRATWHLAPHTVIDSEDDRVGSRGK